jgi:hypothetical protein
MVTLNGSFLTIHIPNNLRETINHTWLPYPPCGDPHFETCWDCPKFDMDECKLGYNLSRYIQHNKNI